MVKKDNPRVRSLWEWTLGKDGLPLLFNPSQTLLFKVNKTTDFIANPGLS